MRKKYTWAFCLSLVFIILSGFSPRSEGEDLCCARLALFVPIPMPPEQESDASGKIASSWSSAINESNIHDCPIEYEELSWEGRIELDKLVEAIGEVSGAPADPQAREAFKNLLDVEYIWKGTLALNRIDEIEPGYWEEGYLGKKNYVPGQAYGDWTLHMKLVNVHFDEVVKGGSASWTGSASGSGSDAVKNLARTVFSPVDDIIYDYEHIPRSCEVEPEEDDISVGDKMSITIKDIKDSKGREPKPWQRIVVKVEKGEITNGVKLGEEKSYAFLVGDGEVEMEYKAPEEFEESGTEKVTVYNSCDWGQEWVLPLRVTLPQKDVGEGEFEITCDWEGTIESGFKLGSSGDESLITALVPKSKYQGITDWKLDVVFKLDRGNERVRIYELKSAKFSFSSTLEFEWKMEAKEGKFQTGGNWAAKEGRELSRSECDLELIIDLKKQTYKIEGILHVKNIAEKFKGEFELDVPPIHGGEKESDEQMIEHKEEILIEGEFSEDFPWELEGSVDEMKELPADFAEFMEAWAGNITGKISWRFKKKGKH